jgi:hypothetical protein
MTILIVLYLILKLFETKQSDLFAKPQNNILSHIKYKLSKIPKEYFVHQTSYK